MNTINTLIKKRTRNCTNSRKVCSKINEILQNKNKHFERIFFSDDGKIIKDQKQWQIDLTIILLVLLKIYLNIEDKVSRLLKKFK